MHSSLSLIMTVSPYQNVGTPPTIFEVQLDTGSVILFSLSRFIFSFILLKDLPRLPSLALAPRSAHLCSTLLNRQQDLAFRQLLPSVLATLLHRTDTVRLQHPTGMDLVLSRMYVIVCVSFSLANVVEWIFVARHCCRQSVIRYCYLQHLCHCVRVHKEQWRSWATWI